MQTVFKIEPTIFSSNSKPDPPSCLGFWGHPLHLLRLWASGIILGTRLPISFSHKQLLSPALLSSTELLHISLLFNCPTHHTLVWTAALIILYFICWHLVALCSLLSLLHFTQDGPLHFQKHVSNKTLVASEKVQSHWPGVWGAPRFPTSPLHLAMFQTHSCSWSILKVNQRFPFGEVTGEQLKWCDRELAMCKELMEILHDLWIECKVGKEVCVVRDEARCVVFPH